ncbi:hypothetical protein ID866_2964 [Astraeus odoratus]|nr:hypothetical protein ID866_2964 [Astraeus odoratus]
MAAAAPVSSTSDKIAPGHGYITCSLNGSSVVFSELSSTYPLKLNSPRLPADAVAIVYVMSYGGGLVCGDRIRLHVRVEGGSKLLLLSQGSTKVFKTRPTNRASTRLGNSAEHDALHSATTQLVDIRVSPGSAVFLLPDPVTCFRSASYTQIQRFHLSRDASMVLLDWFTSGRKSLGEEWDFSRYYSVNELIIDGRYAARDVMLLEDPFLRSPLAERVQHPRSSRPLNERLKPYSCYAMLILCGPLVQNTVTQLNRKLQSLSVFKTATPPQMLWAMTPVDDGRVFVIRAAGVETEIVKNWLRESLRPLEDIVGVDTYRKAFL